MQQENIGDLRRVLQSGLPLHQREAMQKISKIFETLKHVRGQSFVVTGEEPKDLHQKYKGSLSLTHVNITPIGVIAGLIDNSGHHPVIAGKRLIRAIVYVKEHETFRYLFSKEITTEKRILLNDSILLSLSHEHVLEDGPAKEMFLASSRPAK